MEKDNFKHSAVDEHSKDKDAISLPTHGSSAEICQINNDSTNTAQEKVTKPCMKTTSKAKGKRRYKYCFKDILRNVTGDKVSARQFMQQYNILPSSMICEGPKCADERTASCGQPMSLKAVKDRSDGVTWRCRKVHDVLKNGKHTCVKDVKLSIRHNTWIEDSNLSLEVILELIYLWTQGMNQLELSHELGISERSLIEWRAYFRDVCTYICLKESQAIGGPGVEVEIDESKFGKRKYYRGHRVDGKWVFGGREKNDKSKIFMFAVDNRKKPTLIPLIKKWIRPGSIIHSDCFKTYHCLPKLGYTHLTVNHSKEFKNKETGACTNKIECEWRHAKVAMPDYGVHRGLHDGYLAKFLWHRKYYDKDKFLTLIGHCNEAFTQKQMECIKC